MPSFHFQNTTIYYCLSEASENEDGDKIDKDETLVFLHGFLEDHSIWDQIIPSFLQDGYQCLSIDLPCHGQSRFNEAICTMEFMANAVDALLSELKLSPRKVVGHSMGGYVSLELSKLRQIEPILLHSNFWADPEEKKNDRNRVIEIVKKNKALFINEAIPGLFAPINKANNKEVINQLIKKANLIPASEICAATAGLRDREAFYSLDNNQRFSILHGDLDPIIPTKKMLSELDKVANFHLFSSMPDVGHMGIWEDPKTVISSIKSILIS